MILHLIGISLCRNQVKDNIIKMFAGPADTGVFSPSVQNTIHLTQKLVLDTIPEVEVLNLSQNEVNLLN